MNFALPGQGVLGMSYTDEDIKAFHKACFGGKRKAVRPLLLAKPTLIAGVRSDGLSALHIAANGGHVKLCRLLLEAGAVVEAKESHGATPLSIAAQQGSAGVVKLLLEHKADPNSLRNDGVPPLFIAAQEGHAKVVAALLAGGAELDAELANGATALYIAAQKGNDKVVSVLLSKGARTDVRVDQVTPLEAAVRYGHLRCMDLLIRAGGSVYPSGVPVAAPGSGIVALNQLDDLQARLADVLHKTPIKSNSIGKDPEGRPLLGRPKLKKKDMEKLSKKEIADSYKLCVTTMAKMGDELMHIRGALKKELEETQKELTAWKSAYVLLQERDKVGGFRLPSIAETIAASGDDDDSSSHKEHII